MFYKISSPSGEEGMSKRGKVTARQGGPGKAAALCLGRNWSGGGGQATRSLRLPNAPSYISGGLRGIYEP